MVESITTGDPEPFTVAIPDPELDELRHRLRGARWPADAGGGVIPTDSPNLTVDHTWDTMGMRATGSHTIVLDGVPAAPDTFGGNFRQGLVGEAEWAAMLFGGVYLGLAEKAYAEAGEILRTKHLGATMGGQDTAVKQIGYVQHALGRMRTDLDVASRVLEATGQTAISVTDEACRLVGGVAFRRGHVLERPFRDARAGYLHSFTTNQLYDFRGRHELGLLG